MSQHSETINFLAQHDSFSSDNPHRHVQDQINNGPGVEDSGFPASVNDDYAFSNQDGEGVIDANIGSNFGADGYTADPAAGEENSGPRSRLLLNSKGEKGKRIFNDR